jgi:hypothetical protein
MSNPNFNGICYAAADLATLQSDAPEGLFVTDPITEEVTSTIGQIMKTSGWLVEPVYGDADPETGEPVVLSPGTRPPAVCLLVPADQPIPALEAYSVRPFGWGGWA